MVNISEKQTVVNAKNGHYSVICWYQIIPEPAIYTFVVTIPINKIHKDATVEMSAPCSSEGTDPPLQLSYLGVSEV